MTKKFCDICGKPAHDKDEAVYLWLSDVIKKRIGYTSEKAYLCLTFGTMNSHGDHSSSIDLCASCKHELINKQLDAIKDETNPLP